MLNTLESPDEKLKHRPWSKNRALLNCLMCKSNMTRNTLRPIVETKTGYGSKRLGALQLFFWCFDPPIEMTFASGAFQSSQRLVFSHPVDAPFFLNINLGYLNIHNLLHFANFFYCHQHMYSQFCSVFRENNYMIYHQAWRRPVRTLDEMSRRWTGTCGKRTI